MELPIFILASDETELRIEDEGLAAVSRDEVVVIKGSAIVDDEVVGTI